MRTQSPTPRRTVTTGTPGRLEVSNLPPRRSLVAAARRVLWDRLRERVRALSGSRSALRRRLGDFLRACAASRLLRILRSGALAGAVAAALLWPSPAAAQAIELADVARGVGGFIVRGEGQPLSSASASVSAAGDVNGDGVPDLIVAGRFCPTGQCLPWNAYVVFGKRDGAPVELRDILAGAGGFAIRGRAVHGGFTPRVSGAGDVNGDGLADLLIGAPQATPDAGESFVVFGKRDGTAVELRDIQAGAGGFAIRGSVMGDQSGRSVSGAGDVNGDGLADLLIGAPYARSDAGESYVVFGKQDGAAVELRDVQAGRGGFAVRGNVVRVVRSGWSVSGAGDVNGDGLADLLIGAFMASPADRGYAGESYVVFGKRDGATVALSDIEAGAGGFAIRGRVEFGIVGWRVSGAGDVNGDGLADLLVGTGNTAPGTYGRGEVYVVFGRRDGATVELSDIEAGAGGFAIRGSAEGDYSGVSVSGAGDVNGDGLADLLIGAHRSSPGGRSRAGESYIVFGKRDGAAVDLSDVQAGAGGFAIRGSAERDESGFSVSGAGDVNGDGLADLVIGAPGAVQSYVVFGKRGGSAIDLSDVQAGAGGFAIRGSWSPGGLGFSVSGAGDVNGDGLADLLVGARFASPRGRARAGESFVVFGKRDGAAIELLDVQAGAGVFAIRGSAPDDQSGSSVAGAGDVNGDGLADLLIGAPFASPAGRAKAGESYVVFGKRDGVAVELRDVQAGTGGFAIRGSAPGDESGRSVSGGGDINGDGFADVLIAAGLADSPYSTISGAAYVVFGGPKHGRPRFLRGDVNSSGRINLTDGTALFRHLFFSDPAALPCRESADVQNDGAIDISDGIYVLRWLFTGGPEPAAPGPSGAPCGYDPDPPGSPADLGCADYPACP